MEKEIKDALKDHGIECNAVVEVDPVENDWLITGVKQVGAKVSDNLIDKRIGHPVPAGKSIIRRLEDLADSDFKRYMKHQPQRDNPNEDWSHPDNNSALKAAGLVLNHLDSRVEGICECLAVMKNSSRGVEYEAVLDRYQNEITVGEARPNG